ncbi:MULTISPECIES: hypothetical protein [Bacillus]|uniref:hypothetical protein n=1 Tax=Bacillus TaxID=1386 RepID=UPI000B5DABEA|nr:MULTISPECIES: hypothetical protein [Bacillus]OXB99491.1 hypothetical protein CGQ22_07685 [Bacillus sp. M13(2017)]QCY61405.1 hypothetical protein FHE73_11615 [Bacillus thuringiensis]
MKEVVAIIFLRSHPVAGLAVNWHVFDKATGEIIRNNAFSRFRFEIVDTIHEVMQEITGVCNEFDLRLTDIRLERG